MLKSDLIQAQFSILRNDNLQCRNFFFLSISTTTTTTAHHPKPGTGSEPDREYNNGGGHTIKTDFFVTGPAAHGDDHVPYGPGTGTDSQLGSPKGNTPHFDNSNGENINDRNTARYNSFVYAFVFSCNLTVAVLVALISRTLVIT